MSKARVSIVVPVYNSALSVQATLQSLLNQTLRDIEIIAVNDASTDDSGSVLNWVSKRDSRLKVMYLAENVGVHEARAVGIHFAKGAWIGFLDADDFAKPSMFEKLYQRADAEGADISTCGSEMLTPGRERLGNKVCFSKDCVLENDIFESFCQIRLGTGALWNKLYRADLMKRRGTIKFRWRQNANEDTLVNIGCFLEARKVSLLKDILHQYVRHPTGASIAVTRPQALTWLLRAYAVAIETYGTARESAPQWITELYRRQLAYDDYQVESSTDLMMLRKELAEAFALLSQIYPEGLALLASKRPTPSSQPESLRSATGTIWRLSVGMPFLLAKAVTRRARRAAAPMD